MKCKKSLKVLFFLWGIIILCLFLFYGLSSFSGLGGETLYEDYNSYAEAVGLAVADVDRALDLCSKSGKMRDECFTSIAMVIVEKNFERSLDICEGIVNAGWRGECFFVIAKSLPGKNFSLASKICEKSEMFKPGCYGALGIFLTDSFDNVSFVISACNEFPVEFRGDCFNGLGMVVGEHLNSDTSSAVSACNQVPVEFRGYCFIGLGRGFVGGREFVNWRFGGNISHAVSACNQVPVEFKRACFEGLSVMVVNEHFSGDVSRSIPACNEIPVEFRGDCFNRLGWAVGRRFGNDTSSAIFACEEVPVEFRQYCINSSIGFYNSRLNKK